MAIMKLINLHYANKDIMTGFGKLSFNEAGEVEVEQEVANALKELKGFSIAEENEQDAEETPDAEEDTADPMESENMGESEQQEDKESVEEPSQKDSEDTEEDSDDATNEYTFEELDALNVAQLKKIATEAGIDTKNLTKKAQLISGILG